MSLDETFAINFPSGTDEEAPEKLPDEITYEPELDRSVGSGSLTISEGWASANSHVPDNDGRSDTRTTFYQGDDTLNPHGPPQRHRDPADRSSWNQLTQWNDGVGESDRDIKNSRADYRRWAQTFSGQLGLTSYQKRRVVHIVDKELSLQDYRPHPAEVVILGVISLVADVDTTEIDNWIVYRDDFNELLDDLGADLDDIWTIRKLVHSNTDIFDGDNSRST